jgi:predicted nucleic acid-binding protein
VVEGALIRFLVRSGLTGKRAKAVLGLVARRPGRRFWADDTSYREADIDSVLGRRQVTDAYLASLARRRGQARLATLNGGLAQNHPDVALLIP